MKEQLEILRRIAERGLAHAEKTEWNGIDLWIHLLDELERAAAIHGINE